MSILFLTTMYTHYLRIDIQFFVYSLFTIVWLAIPSGVIGFIFFKINTIFKIIIGMIIGPIAAALYLSITLY